MSEAIKVENLTLRYGNYTAVNNISFTVPKGIIFGYLGPNGSGKTSTIRMLCGIRPPTSGSAYILGYNIATHKQLVKQNIGYMSQKFSLYEDLTVNENLSFFARIYSISPKEESCRKQEMIKFGQLEGREKVLAGNLSGGLKQRLALGCALIHRPKLLYLDEPTAGVDPLSRKVFWDIIKHLTTQGVTIFLTTHYMDEADGCDLLAFMYRGNMEAFGTPAELKQQKDAGSLEALFIKLVEEREREG